MSITNMLSRIANRITNVINHPQFQKMKNYYTNGLPIAVMIGGISGTMIGVSMLDKYIEERNFLNILIRTDINPRKCFAIILGSFCAGLVGGVFYPVALPFSTGYLINQMLNHLKED